MVTVTEVDEKRSRIALSMKTEDKAAPRKRSERKEEKAPQTDMAAKLAALAGKFK
ncbi:hypothetical protein [Sphingobacterium alimentarium]|uniref:hypothetical protein n=1 Tax=Sphingobacterium alimentarium TaxID=797292 RepID=UPI001404A912|nr:hypothetical protein [Sphingobacterium alimentarium]